MTVEIKVPEIGSQGLQNILNTDPLQVAEDITGKSYKSSEATSMLGFGLAIQHNKMKEKVLQGLGDTTLSMNMGPYLKIVENLGFKKIYEEAFKSVPFLPDDTVYDEMQYIYFHPERGMLLETDTFHGTSRNSAKVYFEIKPKPERRTPGMNLWPEVQASGGFHSPSYPNRVWEGSLPEDAVMVGDLDAREALVHNLTLLDNYGTYVTPWLVLPHRKHLWLLHYGDTRELERIEKEAGRKIPKDGERWPSEFFNMAKISKFPEEVQAAISAQQFL